MSSQCEALLRTQQRLQISHRVEVKMLIVVSIGLWVYLLLFFFSLAIHRPVCCSLNMSDPCQRIFMPGLLFTPPCALFSLSITSNLFSNVDCEVLADTISKCTTTVAPETSYPLSLLIISYHCLTPDILLNYQDIILFFSTKM